MPFRETIKKAGAFGTAFVAAALTEHYGVVSAESASAIAHLGAPVLTVLSHLFTHLGFEYVVPIGEEIVEHFNQKDPDQLNHNIQKLVLESMGKAVDSIAVLYKKKCPNVKLTRENKEFFHRFKKEFPEYFSPAKGNTIGDNDLKKIIFASKVKDDNSFLFTGTQTDVVTARLNEILAVELSKKKIDTAISDFFSEKFVPLMQFYFGEALKSEKNLAARVALERMLSEETLIGINKLLQMQQKTEAEIEELKQTSRIASLGKLPDDKFKELTTLLVELSQPGKLEGEFSAALDEKFAHLFEQYKALHDDVRDIRADVHIIKHTVSRYIPVAVTIAGLAVIIATVVVVVSIKKPFDVVISLQKDKLITIPDSYPSMRYPAKLTLLLPDGRTEVATIDDNEKGVFLKVDSRWRGERMPVKLQDVYWEATDDSVEISNERTILSVRPNGSLRKISGTVLSRTGGEMIVGATVHIGSDTVVYSNSRGEYAAMLPFRMLKEIHKIRVEAEGYISEDEYYRPDSNPLQFRLSSIEK